MMPTNHGQVVENFARTKEEALGNQLDQKKGN